MEVVANGTRVSEPKGDGSGKMRGAAVWWREGRLTRAGDGGGRLQYDRKKRGVQQLLTQRERQDSDGKERSRGHRI